MTVTTTIAAVRDVAPGTSVSYGGRWTAQRQSKIATLPIGYADGVPRTQAMCAHGFVMVRGRRCPVTGTICMDLMMADVTDAGAAEGDPVVLMGDEPTAWDVADCAGTNAWDALTRIGARVPRVYVENDTILFFDSKYRF
jgi:Alr-MurF fusion protein